MNRQEVFLQVQSSFQLRLGWGPPCLRLVEPTALDDRGLPDLGIEPTRVAPIKLLSSQQSQTAVPILIPITLLGWIPFSIALFVLLPPRRAVVASIIGAWLLLPPACHSALWSSRL